MLNGKLAARKVACRLINIGTGTLFFAMFFGDRGTFAAFGRYLGTQMNSIGQLDCDCSLSLGLVVGSRKELIYQVYEAVQGSPTGEDENPIP